MPDLRVTVIAFDENSADLLVAMAPEHAFTTLVLVGSQPGALSAQVRALPVARLLAVPGVSASSDVGAVGQVLAATVQDSDVVVLDSAQPARDLAGWLAATLDAPVVWAVDAIRALPGGGIEADRVVLGGSHRLVHRVGVGRLAIVLAKPTRTASSQGRVARGPAEVRALDVSVPTDRFRVLTAAAEGSSGPSLGGARTIISIGRGIGGPERVASYRELAERTGAALGASRVAVDSGWIPFSHQIGQTGTAVAPEVYVAFGISGAVQHLAGMRGSKSVIAVNTDLQAPMCRVADVVVNADANEVVDALLKRLADAD